MKIHFLITLLILLPMVANAQVTESEAKSAIVGKWMLYTETSFVHTNAEFKSDGSFILTSTKYPSEVEYGTYKIEGDALYQKMSNEDDWFKSKIWRVDAMSLVLQEYDGKGIQLINNIYMYINENPQPAKEVNPLLIGKWDFLGSLPSSSFSMTNVEYKSDGTFSYTSTKEPDYEEHGVYRVDSDIVYEKFSNEDDWEISKIKTLDTYNLVLVELKKDGLTERRELYYHHDATGSIGAPHTSTDREVETIHSIEGVRLQAPSKGINVIKMKDGTTKKVLMNK